MPRGLFKSLGVSSGAGMAGLFIGGAEGLYRAVDPLYAALLYGAVCAAGGLALQLACALLPASWRPKREFALGFCLPSALLLVVMGQFILFRDAFAEEQSYKLITWGLALLISATLTGIAYAIGKAIHHNFNVEGLYKTPSLLLVFAILTGFGLRASQSEELLAHDEERAPAILNGSGVILIVADALRADALGVYGASPSPTPTLDTLANKAAFFSDATGHASWTRPAMASVMSSRHVPGHGVMSKLSALPAQLPTLATVLHEQGIKTAGVVTNYNLEDRYGFGAGFDDYRYLSPARYLGAPEGANRLVAYNVYRLLREKLFKKSREPRFFYRTATDVNREGLAVLDRIGNERFFLWLHYMEPHDPFFAEDGTSYARVSTPHPELSAAETFRSAYQADIKRLDAGIASLLKGLKARGLEERVTIAFTSDHGEEFAEHGGYYHGVTLYQEMLHIPFFVAGPAIEPVRRDDIARHIDIAPTVAALFDVTPDASWEGRNLLSDSEPPAYVFAQEDHQGNQLESIRSLLDRGHKLVRANTDNPRGLASLELFDLSRDPAERQPLDSPRESRELIDLMEKAQTEQRIGAKETKPVALDADAEAELRALGYVE